MVKAIVWDGETGRAPDGSRYVLDLASGGYVEWGYGPTPEHERGSSRA